MKTNKQYRLKTKISAIYLRWGSDDCKEKALMPEGLYTYLGEGKFAVSDQAVGFVSEKHVYKCLCREFAKHAIEE